MASPSLRWVTQIGVYLAASPYAFAILFLYGIVWAVFGAIDFHGVAVLVVWFMTLFIQRAEHRDTQAIHAKLDELLHAHGGARSNLSKLDEEEPEDIEKFREREHQKDDAKGKRIGQATGRED
jgi:low affinity Fe/Cu permease